MPLVVVRNLLPQHFHKSGPFGPRSAYVKLRDRASYEFALASVALAMEMANGKIRSTRIGFGGVATKPWRASNVERVLTGKTPSEELFADTQQGGHELPDLNRLAVGQSLLPLSPSGAA